MFTVALQFFPLETYTKIFAFSFLFASVLGVTNLRFLKLYAIYVAALLTFYVFLYNMPLVTLVMSRDFNNEEFHKQVYYLAGWVSLIGGCLAY